MTSLRLSISSSSGFSETDALKHTFLCFPALLTHFMTSLAADVSRTVGVLQYS